MKISDLLEDVIDKSALFKQKHSDIKQKRHDELYNKLKRLGQEMPLAFTQQEENEKQSQLHSVFWK